ncbi:MAG: SDR family NAD(P)-dependent oxidoreductase [Phenylobacterium sp.]|uniref:SDR family NAD(P)-dependent oxidoreductase n=1 Tax=Phenylobacterium sp. TaxID=1871053 RepID=UPI002733F36D|nr:SDR family NAD(P)-dependent oxidoreductase [Phenylobacterium sp.]MDP3174235.1 SDR family NAD(P)-dependent oxidoreductase [Phenylobacterium sp.]
MQRAPRLAGKVAIVTGASRGLGQHCAMMYAAEGAKVVVVGRNAKENPMRLPGTVFQTAEAIEEFTGGQALAIVCDVTDEAAVESMVDQVLDRWGRIDVLLNNAAYVMAEGEGVAGIPLRLFDQMLQVNVLAAFHVIRAVLPAMQAKRFGNIINVSGRSRTRGSPLEATKAAMETLTVGLADELKADGVAVNSLRPFGFVDTPGVLLNSEVKPSDLMPAYSYLDAAVLLAMQTADTYTGNVKTDAEIIRELSDAATLQRYAEINPPAWSASLQLAGAR